MEAGNRTVRKMKVLLSAYACEPYKGSEPDVGFQTLLTVAAHHEVWLATRENNVETLERYLDDNPTAHPVHLVGFDLSRIKRPFKRLGLPGLIWYYDRWQKAIEPFLAKLDSDVGFDVVYHVTFAAYWMRAGASVLDKPFVWGPVGGGVDPPLRLVPELGLRGMLEDAARVPFRRLMAALPAIRRAQMQATVVLVNNPQTGEKIARHSQARIEVLPNPTAVRVLENLEPRYPKLEIAYVARLIPWKAAHLAIRAMRYLANRDAKLVVYGGGSENGRLRRAIKRWRLQQRVELVGKLPRAEVLTRLADSAALIHPAIHEEGGNAVAEGLAMNVPTVCLAHGGPATTVTLFPKVASRAVSPAGPTKTAQRLAAALDEMLEHAGTERPGGFHRAELDYQERVLAALEEAAAAGRH